MPDAPKIEVFISTAELFDIARAKIATCIEGQPVEIATDIEPTWVNALTLEDRYECLDLVPIDGVTISINIGPRDLPRP
jgi:hypothetical protein